jgi:hypothetical protein
MKYIVVSIAFVAVCLGFAPYAAAQTAPAADQLIDQLMRIDCHGPGLYTSPYQDFWAVIPSPYPREVIKGPDGECIPDAMRELVRLGPQALPALVRHIDDARPTGLKIGSKLDPNARGIGGQLFADEYESRAHSYRGVLVPYPAPFLDACKDDECMTGPAFDDPYTIKVGDICFVLIGQIVNRHLVAARYQMTEWVLVTSPVEMPALAAKVRADWTGVDTEGLKAALLADLRTQLRPAPDGHQRPFPDGLTYDEYQAHALRDVYAGALRRLRFYYPNVYASLSGDDLAKRQAFERAEHDRSQE